MIDKIPFKVSARTARLIGRENVATAKGAIIELVKNGYDADSPFCIVFIDNKYGVYHSMLTKEDYEHLLSLGIDTTLLGSIYQARDGAYYENTNVDILKIGLLKEVLRSYTNIYIIDGGDGMTENIIRNYWMTIGTDNKSSHYLTNGGRVRAGAKGIGRFALDKLGEQCEMYTFPNDKVHKDKEVRRYTGYHWHVNWNDFENDNTTIDRIDAELEGISNHSYMDMLKTLPLTNNLKHYLWENKTTHGTIIKISKPRDVWEDDAINRVYEDLGVLVPPTENPEFTIFLQSLDKPAKYGKIDSPFCDEFDYKVVAHAETNQTVNIQIFRQEYNTEAISPSFFDRENQKKYPYRKEDFIRGYWTTVRTFSQLIPGFRDTDIDRIFEKIGSFDFSFYYLKRSATRQDETRFFYRQCPYNLRKSWLDKYGGIKLFRDKFRVRPYGEKHDSAFDWLGLGIRKNNSPAGIAKSQGGYRVESENIAGSILISRISNIDFEDKSSREGLQENKTFSIFKQIIIGIIKIFEDDRSLIAREFVADDEFRNGEVRDRERAEELANKIIAENRGKQNYTKDEDSTDYRLHLLAAVNEQKNEEIKQLREEQRILRALASSGLMLASFAHDLSKLNDSLQYRYEKIENLFNAKVTVNDFPNVRRKNPFLLLNQAKENDIKMQRWLNFSTDIVKKDKRRRKSVGFIPYLDKLEETWSGLLEERGIKFIHSNVDDAYIRAFEIDFDSIFYNLMSNSIEAFIRMKEDRERIIEITVEITERAIVCSYHDNGPGLSKDIVTPNDIFQPLFTTKRSASTGEEVGTGLGMWLVKLIAEDNDARIVLLTPNEGFGLQIIFPIKYKNSYGL